MDTSNRQQHALHRTTRPASPPQRTRPTPTRHTPPHQCRPRGLSGRRGPRRTPHPSRRPEATRSNHQQAPPPAPPAAPPPTPPTRQRTRAGLAPRAAAARPCRGHASSPCHPAPTPAAAEAHRTGTHAAASAGGHHPRPASQPTARPSPRRSGGTPRRHPRDSTCTTTYPGSATAHHALALATRRSPRLQAVRDWAHHHRRRRLEPRIARPPSCRGAMRCAPPGGAMRCARSAAPRASR